MKFSIPTLLLSISLSTASPLFRRDESCTIIPPDGFIHIPISDLSTGTYSEHSKLPITNNFEASYTTVNGVSFSGLSGGNGPCALKFYFKSSSSFTSAAGTGQLNIYRVYPNKKFDTTYLLGTVNLRKYDPSTFPKVFEVNSPACPTEEEGGKLIVGVVAARDDGTVVKFEQGDYEGMFVFKGNCYGEPKEGDYQLGNGGDYGKDDGGDEGKGDDYKGEDDKGDDYKGNEEEEKGNDYEEKDNKGDDYKEEDNKGDDYKPEDNKGDDYKGEENKGDDYKPEDNKGDDYKGNDDKGEDYKDGGDDKGTDYKGGDDKETKYEGSDDSKE